MSRKISGMFEQTQKCDAVALFAANMRRIRKAKAFTQEQVAERAGLHPNYISSVERCERNISLRNIERIAYALGVTMAELVADDNLDDFCRNGCQSKNGDALRRKEHTGFPPSRE
jgi:transcriptional regulator with XRE-family HTH domain